MDRFMHLIGLHGKSVIPICLGFGCNVPAVMGTRIIESPKERLITVFLAPFVPCTARLTVLTFVTAAVFPHHAILVSSGILTLNMIMLGIVGMVVKRVTLKDEATPFIMELPLYHKPDMKVILTTVWMRLVSFIKKAGTVILFVSAAIWLLSYLPTGQMETSYLARVGKAIEPLGRLVGLDWRLMTALLAGIVAKENAVATLAVLYSVGREGLLNTLPAVLSPAATLSFLVVLMLFVPCAATATVMHREFKNLRWSLLSFGSMLAISFVAGFVVYHLGRAWGLP